jgi:hypothetical protein
MAFIEIGTVGEKGQYLTRGVFDKCMAQVAAAPCRGMIDKQNPLIWWIWGLYDKPVFVSIVGSHLSILSLAPDGLGCPNILMHIVRDPVDESKEIADGSLDARLALAIPVDAQYRPSVVQGLRSKGHPDPPNAAWTL